MAKTKYNSFGMFAAKRRAKLKAEREEAEMKKPAKQTNVKTKKVAPNLDWNPMANKKIKMPKYPINWNDPSTDTHSSNLLNALSSEKFKLLSMPTGTGKTAVTIETIGKMQIKLGKKIPFVVTAPTKVVQGLGWHNTIKSWNENNPNNILEPVLITSIDKFRAACEHLPTCGKIMRALGTDGLIILDEVQKYKNPTGKRAKQLQKFKDYKKIGLSATPLTNDIVMDSASYLIIGDYYKNKTQFMQISGLLEWMGQFNQLMIYNADGSVNKTKWPYYDKLLSEWANVLYKPDINIKDLDMPEITKHIIQLPFDDQLNADMRSLNNAYKKRMFDSFSDYFMEYVERVHNDIKRKEILKKILSDKNIKQPLIFYQNVIVKEIIINILDELNMPYQSVAGDSSFSDVDLESNHPILVQYQSGSEGIEMKNSNTTIFFQNQTSYDRLKQARGRNVRRGMKNDDGTDVLINQYYIIADDPLDQELFNRVTNREEISEQMLQDIVENIIKGKV